eukprot:765306-Hanusia_phi.AAC.3
MCPAKEAAPGRARPRYIPGTTCQCHWNREGGGGLPGIGRILTGCKCILPVRDSERKEGARPGNDLVHEACRAKVDDFDLRRGHGLEHDIFGLNDWIRIL